ncbi:MobF family relaxase [Kitasatospora kifunensis]|uniref:Conjugative relaxase-like TrwC/TraI family protein n=1 Tax=Kitasatospora kifunensis TaxID=58351 RepID=A0A7W7RBQ0_KITKI|nr:MobF family relaxase [Kitasatospora kifunensis]MBB4929046.1 conjugative relaxase-like TrwC/TraI family protein [Kitasatospora kifunensis]
MMTVHKLSAGDGYTYYLRETVSSDSPREAGTKLGDYYLASGNPPGVWMGGGAALLGVSGTVTEAQMRALYGEGLHPEADAIIAERIAAGDTAKQAVRHAKLGRSYYRYKMPDTPFARLLTEELETFARRSRREPSPQERATLRGKAAAVAFRIEHGRGPQDKEELGRFITAQEKAERTAVAGFDAVFGSKELSLLMAYGDQAVRQIAIEAHEQAIAETLQWLEKNAAATRTGVNGVAQVDALGGLVATRFRHWDSRNGDPFLHDHVVISTKVCGPDGKWRSLDGQLFLAQTVSASELYNQRSIEIVCERLGLRAAPREVTPGKRPVMSIAGLGEDLIEAASTRSVDIKERLVDLVNAYRETHGKEPSVRTMHALSRQATLAGRPEKKSAKPLPELLQNWRQNAVGRFGSDRIDSLLRDLRAAGAGVKPSAEAVPHLDLDQAAKTVVETVAEHRAVWGRRHLLAEARRWVVLTTGAAAPTGDLAERITDLALTSCIDLTPPDLNPAFEPLQRADGSSIYRRRESELYTSPEVLAAEDCIAAAADTKVIPVASLDDFHRAEEAYRQANPDKPLDAGQRALALAFATGEYLASGGIGPAGAGKTTAMRLAADAVREAGGRVIGLGPSARSAAVLAEDIKGSGSTLHDWLAMRQRASEGGRIPAAYELRPGDMVVIDEAGMAGSLRVANVINEAVEAGAVVRLVGDPWQLSSVESGGALRWLDFLGKTIHLESLHRFRTTGEGAASLLLRHGEPDKVWRWYLRNQRIVSGDQEQMLHEVFRAWQSDVDAGRKSLMMADNADTVTQLNLLAQAHRAAAGLLDFTAAVNLRDGSQAAVGDMIVTRKNRRRTVLLGGKDWLKNGDHWTIQAITGNGGLIVKHTRHGGRTVLPADYVSAHVELGYASTVHRAQGVTVDTAHALVSRRTSRESAYVAATRGAETNRLYVALEAGERTRDVLDAIARADRAARTARETIKAEQERAWSVAQLAAEYRDVQARANSLRYQAMARAELGIAAASLITSDAWHSVERALADAEQAGFTAERILTEAYRERGFNDADDRAAVLSWRIDHRVEEATKALERLADQGESRPLQSLSADQLASLAATAAQQRTRATQTLRTADDAVASQPRPVVADGVRHTAWPERPHGQLTHAQLAEAIHFARRDSRRTGDEQSAQAQREAAALLASLRREHDLRRSMSRRDRAREEWQREAATSASVGASSGASRQRPARTPAPQDVRAQYDHAVLSMQRADVINMRIAAELRLRTVLPDSAPPTADHTGAVPTWLAAAPAAADRHTPAPWREHLGERRQVIAQRLRQVGQSLAADPPAWAAPLGPVPDLDHRLRALWEHTAALVEAWRTATGVSDAEAGLGPCPSDEHQAEIWRALQERVDDIGRRARALAAARNRPVSAPPPAPPAGDAPRPDSDSEDTIPGWRERRLGRLTDAELRRLLRQNQLALAAAERTAEDSAEQADELEIKAAPGGEIEQAVDALWLRVQAIGALPQSEQALQVAATEVAALQGEVQQLQRILDQTGSFGRPAVRGEDRVLFTAHQAELVARLEQALQQQAEASAHRAAVSAAAGPAGEHPRVLAEWQADGGRYATVLARRQGQHMVASGRLRAEAAGSLSTASKVRRRVDALGEEMRTRAAMSPQTRQAEEVERASNAGSTPSAAQGGNRDQGRGPAGPDPAEPGR